MQDQPAFRPISISKLPSPAVVFAGVLRFIQIFVGYLLLAIGGFCIGITNAGLDTASLTSPGHVANNPAPTATWIAMVLATTLGVALCSSARFSDWLRIDAWQLAAAGLFAAGTLFLAFAMSFLAFIDPDTQCAHASCWPLPYQELLIAAPALLAAVAMSLFAVKGHGAAWWIRSTVPAGIFLLLSVIQFAAWDSMILPFLSVPPPFQ
jgi:hypothetical protein